MPVDNTEMILIRETIVKFLKGRATRSSKGRTKSNKIAIDRGLTENPVSENNSIKLLLYCND